jgi:hypothetical protein
MVPPEPPERFAAVVAVVAVAALPFNAPVKVLAENA